MSTEKNNIFRMATPAIVIMLILMTFSLAAIPSRPEPQRLVNDWAGLFSVSEANNLERTLVEFDDTTSNQIAVITTEDLEGYDIASYATQIGIKWKVGSEKFDNGIVIVIKPKTDDSSGKVFIAVGYGLEGAIPDIYAKRIINDIMIPHFMQNDYYGGTVQACSALMKLASGEYSEMRDDFDVEDVLMISSIIFFFAIFLMIIILASKGNNGGSNGSGGRRTVIYTGPIITSGNNFGGGGFGSGFSGGFGGFGGGSFGGGGAGGSW